MRIVVFIAPKGVYLLLSESNGKLAGMYLTVRANSQIRPITHEYSETPRRNSLAALKIRTICQARDMWKLVRFVNSCVYYARQAHEIYKALPYSEDSKARNFEIYRVRQLLVNVFLCSFI